LPNSVTWKVSVPVPVSVTKSSPAVVHPTQNGMPSGDVKVEAFAACPNDIVPILNVAATANMKGRMRAKFHIKRYLLITTATAKIVIKFGRRQNVHHPN
jgi:hypothetical protein